MLDFVQSTAVSTCVTIQQLTLVKRLLKCPWELADLWHLAVREELLQLRHECIRVIVAKVKLRLLPKQHQPCLCEASSYTDLGFWLIHHVSFELTQCQRVFVSNGFIDYVL
jgi:hypothetical protein